MSKQFWIHAGLTVAGTTVGVLTPAVAQFAAHHTAWAATILGIWALVGALLDPKKNGQ